LFAKSKCYQPICFQYSIHRRNSAADMGPDDRKDIDHFEFLAQAPEASTECPNRDYTLQPLVDIRIEFIKHLISDIGSCGSILVYSSYERARLRDLIVDFPEYKSEINDIIARLVDLAEPFRKKHYYHHDMQGSYSIKYVFPALIPEMKMAYKELEIGKGDVASSVFLEMLTGVFQGDWAACRRNLLTYCQLDTWAMVMILSKLITCCNDFYGGRHICEPVELNDYDVEHNATPQVQTIDIIHEDTVPLSIDIDVPTRHEGTSAVQHPIEEFEGNVDSLSSQQRLLELADVLSQSDDGIAGSSSIVNEQEQFSSALVTDSNWLSGSVDACMDREVFMLHKSLIFDEKYANILARNAAANITIDGGRVQLQFRFNIKVIEAIKLYISHRSYDHATKSWSCPLSSLSVAIKLYEFMGKVVTIDPQYLTSDATDSYDRLVKIDIHFPSGRESLPPHHTSDSNGQPPAFDNVSGGFALVTFDYDAEVVTALKEIDPYRRSYNPRKKEWTVDLLFLFDVVEKLYALNYRSVTSSYSSS